MKTLIGVNGACGRMGLRILQLAREDRDLTVAAALETPGHPQQGRDVGEVAGIGQIGVRVEAQSSIGRQAHRHLPGPAGRVGGQFHQVLAQARAPWRWIHGKRGRRPGPTGR